MLPTLLLTLKVLQYSEVPTYSAVARVEFMAVEVSGRAEVSNGR